MQGRVCLITGASNGIGKAAAIRLAKMGASLVLLCRDRDRGETAMAEISLRSGNEDIDLVVLTHLHFDHVGWNTILKDGKWVPTFQNARYLMGESEWGFWKDEDDPYAPEAKHDSILPIFEADLVDLVDTSHVVTDEVRLIPTPGHTPGHVSVVIESQGEQAIITGDLFHHPLQMAHPDWTDSADVNGKLAQETRAKFLDSYADTPTLILGTHFAAPTAGHIVRDGEVYRFEV